MPADPEAWFGLVASRDVADRIGTPRPALAALGQFQRAVLVEPRDGIATAPVMPVRIVAREPVRLEVSVNDGPRYPIELWAAGRDLHEGKLFIPPGGTREAFTFHLLAADGAEIRRERRLLRTAGERSTAITFTPQQQRISPGELVAYLELGLPAAAERLSPAREAPLRASRGRARRDRRRLDASASRWRDARFTPSVASRFRSRGLASSWRSPRPVIAGPARARLADVARRGVDEVGRGFNGTPLRAAYVYGEARGLRLKRGQYRLHGCRRCRFRRCRRGREAVAHRSRHAADSFAIGYREMRPTTSRRRSSPGTSSPRSSSCDPAAWCCAATAAPRPRSIRAEKRAGPRAVRSISRSAHSRCAPAPSDATTSPMQHSVRGYRSRPHY